MKKDIKYFTINDKLHIMYGYRLIIGNEAFRINKDKAYNTCKGCDAVDYCDDILRERIGIIYEDRDSTRYLCGLVPGGVSSNINYKMDKLGLFLSRYLIREVAESGIKLNFKYV